MAMRVLRSTRHGSTRFVVGAVAAGIGLSGCSVTTAGTATPGDAAPLSTAADLPAALLSTEQVGAAFGSPPLVVTGEVRQPWDDAIFVASGGNPACLAMVGAGQRQAYDGSGWTALRGQALRDPSAADAWSRFATQAVVLFETEAAASDFYARSREQWTACSATEMRYPQLGGPAGGAADQVWSVGPVAGDRETLTVSRTQRTPESWSCQRALTVRANVAVDVEACDLTGPTDAAAAMADAIVDRLPAT